LEIDSRDALMAMTKSGASQVNSILPVFSVQTAVLRQELSRIAIGDPEMQRTICAVGSPLGKSPAGLAAAPMISEKQAEEFRMTVRVSCCPKPHRRRGHR
jgi:hypothetical protein